MVIEYNGKQYKSLDSHQGSSRGFKGKIKILLWKKAKLKKLTVSLFTHKIRQLYRKLYEKGRKIFHLGIYKAFSECFEHLRTDFVNVIHPSI